MIIIIKVMIHNMIIKVIITRIDRRVGDGPGRSDRGPSHNQPRASAGEGYGDDDHHHQGDCGDDDHHQPRAGVGQD